MAAHSSILAWEIPQTEELGRLQSMGLHRVQDRTEKDCPFINFLELFSDMTTHQEVKATEIYSLTVLEIRSQKSRFGRVGSF